ncbi:FAD:protein FMN transferase [Flavobacteriaceae bacterium]|nr:FAD:protein FMN transferase [Flavobacteriaceae bacterium]MDC6456689.1 FAD:protein FMN transferase [Flavobacteriaceae bacterium]
MSKRHLKLLLFIAIPCLCFSQEQIISRTAKLMGTRFEITLVSTQEAANQYLNAAQGEIERIERLISSWDANSQTAEINRQAGIKPVKVAKELYELIARSIEISKITQGAFDISYAALDPVWFFDGRMKAVPSESQRLKSVQNIGFKDLVLNAKEQTVYLPKKGMKIGFGAIGKGYAADATKKLMKSLGVSSGIINASGDLTSWGKKPDGTDWQVGISNPENPTKVFSWFPVRDAAVATSGNYEKYVTLEGKQYSHIMDPRTGMPVSGIKSVTVFAPNAELADAFATAVFIMGIDTGIDTISQLPGMSCIIVDAENNIHHSPNIQWANTKK